MSKQPRNFLPGPVGIDVRVQKVFAQTPVSHRNEDFVNDFRTLKQSLCQLTQARRVEILLGSGTLANDVIAGQLSLQLGRGLIISNGEFGDRLADHAGRFGLSFETLAVNWGDAVDGKAIERKLDEHRNIRWMWAVHCETSTGVVNDVSMLQTICRSREIRMCLDCISSFGTIPINLREVDFASAVSGKGLGAFPGLAMVFYNHAVSLAPKLLPRYLDLGLYAASQGIPFTHSSNLVYALRKALTIGQSPNRFKQLVNSSLFLRSKLLEAGFDIITPDTQSSPAVITIALPQGMSSEALGLRLESEGYLLNYRSAYLIKRNWIQVCLMGACRSADIESLIDTLKDLCRSGVGGASIGTNIVCR